MNDYASELATLLELEGRHDELLQRLDELNKQIQGVLNEWLAGREKVPAASDQGSGLFCKSLYKSDLRC